MESGVKPKNALIIASMASMLDNFNRPAIDILLQMGISVDLAANFFTEDSNSSEKNQSFFQEMSGKGHQVHQVNFTRRPGNIAQHLKAYSEVKNIVKEKDYCLVHCHSPISSIISRFTLRNLRKKGVKVLYTAHGFHFFKGAPLKNWLLYFPAEWVCARWTDMLITLNEEDYTLAQKRLPAKQVVYLPGVGVNTKKFVRASDDERLRMREALGIQPEDLLLLSVGELSHRKNQVVAINALAKIKNPRIKYAIAGIGDLHDTLQALIKDKQLENQVQLLGFRTDISLLCAAADAFVFPSFHEGLSVALMEAMACGLPVIASRIRGNTDLIEEGKGGYLVDPHNEDTMVQAIEQFIAHPAPASMGEYNMKRVQDFDIEKVKIALKEIYQSALS